MDYNKMLVDSVEKGDLGSVQSALGHGADMNSRDGYGNTALMLIKSHIEKQTERQKYVFDLNI